MRGDAAIQKHIDIACALALTELERRARQIMKDHPVNIEFVMGMGGWPFHRQHGDSLLDFHCHKEGGGPKYTWAFAEFVNKWDAVFRLTGTPMRFTATGVVRVSW